MKSHPDGHWKAEKEENEIESYSQGIDFEERYHPRFSVGLPIEYCRINNPKYRPGHTINISEGGLMVYLSEQIEIGENLKMKLFFSFGPDLIIIEPVVRVAWADIQVREDGYYRFGVNFVDISPEDRERLKSFIDLYAGLKTPTELKTSMGGCLHAHDPLALYPSKPSGQD